MYQRTKLRLTSSPFFLQPSYPLQLFFFVLSIALRAQNSWIPNLLKLFHLRKPTLTLCALLLGHFTDGSFALFKHQLGQPRQSSDSVDQVQTLKNSAEVLFQRRQKSELCPHLLQQARVVAIEVDDFSAKEALLPLFALWLGWDAYAVLVRVFFVALEEPL